MQAPPHGKKQQPQPRPRSAEAGDVSTGSRRLLAATGSGGRSPVRQRLAPALPGEVQVRDRFSGALEQTTTSSPSPSGSGGDNAAAGVGQAAARKVAARGLQHLQVPRASPTSKVSNSPVSLKEGSPSTSRSAAASSPKVRGKASAEMEAQMIARLDKFFEDPELWPSIVEEVADSAGQRLRSIRRATGRFLVRVPKPYPGLQYRKSKNLDDKVPRKYAGDGEVVAGQVDEDGAWLQVGDEGFLPTNVGAIQILEPLELSKPTPEKGCGTCCAIGRRG